MDPLRGAPAEQMVDDVVRRTVFRKEGQALGARGFGAVEAKNVGRRRPLARHAPLFRRRRHHEELCLRAAVLEKPLGRNVHARERVALGVQQKEGLFGLRLGAPHADDARAPASLVLFRRPRRRVGLRSVCRRGPPRREPRAFGQSERVGRQRRVEHAALEGELDALTNGAEPVALRVGRRDLGERMRAPQAVRRSTGVMILLIIDDVQRHRRTARRRAWRGWLRRRGRRDVLGLFAVAHGRRRWRSVLGCGRRRTRLTRRAARQVVEGGAVPRRRGVRHQQIGRNRVFDDVDLASHVGDTSRVFLVHSSSGGAPQAPEVDDLGGGSRVAEPRGRVARLDAFAVGDRDEGPRHRC
mmetsp:Transcript_15466/g.62231  ORF Transcript_15466/g.62231 Transcript_15466/m.62231 type:complete len:355 (+) Transcript_15466:758-1822(+)